MTQICTFQNFVYIINMRQYSPPSFAYTNIKYSAATTFVNPIKMFLQTLDLHPSIKTRLKKISKLIQH